MQIPLEDEEVIVRETEANHYIDGKLMIGRLFLTNRRLVFRAHLHNFHQYDITIDLGGVASVSYKNNIGIFSHGIWVHETSDLVHHFSVWSRRRWKEAIEAATQQLNRDSI
jgi:hypothetical protein